MKSHPEHTSRHDKAATLGLSLCGPAAGAPNQTTPTTSVLAASTPMILARLSPALGWTRHGNGRTERTTSGLPQGFHCSTFLLGLTALLAALVSIGRHPFLATLSTLGAMALLLHAAAGICGVSTELPTVRNTPKGAL